MKTPAIEFLDSTFTRLYRYTHLAALAGWDQAAMMPAKGNEARAAALAELQVLMHQTLTSQQLAEQLRAVSDTTLDATQRASLREMRRQWQQANLLPERLV
jgi:carboxypeptidase Taq